MNMKKRKDFLTLEEYVSYLEVTVDDPSVQIEQYIGAHSPSSTK